MKKQNRFKKYYAGIICLLIIVGIFGGIGSVMGLPNMLNTIMKTAHDLLLNTVFYLMGMCVITGALGKIFVEFGVVDLLQRLLRPIMRPVFNMPGVASLAAVLTFLSDNPAIIALSQDKGFARYFKKYQHVSLVNFGTAFGMGLLVIVFMIGQGYFVAPIIGFFGTMIGCVIATRLMQYFTLKMYPNYLHEDAVAVTNYQGSEELPDVSFTEDEDKKKSDTSMFVRILNALLDGGKDGVTIGIAIIPGVLIISTFVMLLTFGGEVTGVDELGNEIVAYTGAAYEGVGFLPWIAGKIDFVFEWMFGFTAPELVAFPITALGAVGAALGLIPEFTAQGIIDGNAIAVCTAMGMCWSGYLSTDAATLDSLGYRPLVAKAFLSSFIGGICAGIAAHWMFVLYTLLFGTPASFDGGADRYSTVSNAPVIIEFVSENQVKVGDRVFTDEAGDTPEEEGSLARVIEGVLLNNHDKVEVVDGEKIDAAGFIAVDKFSDETRESLIEEVEAGFEMYRNDIAKKMFNRPVSELTTEEVEALNEAIPFHFAGAEVEDTPAEELTLAVEE